MTSQMRIRNVFTWLFESGKEASFIHSDIAAVRKPKWYLLGTEGALMSEWRDVTDYEIDPVLYYHPQEIPELR